MRLPRRWKGIVMSKKGKAQDKSNRENKRQQFAAPAPSVVRRRCWWIGAALTIGAVGWLIYVLAGSVSAPQEAKAGPPVAVQAAPSGEIRLVKSDLEGGRAKFFEYTAPSGAQVRFFAVKDSGGAYRTALDGCEVCYDARQGYVQQGVEMLCRKCGRSFPIALIGEAGGGCHPIGVPSVSAGGELLIKASHISSLDAERRAQATSPRRPAQFN